MGANGWTRGTRYYRVHLEQDLWKSWVVTSVNGRSGTPLGRVRCQPASGIETALLNLAHIAKRRRQRGFSTTSTSYRSLLFTAGVSLPMSRLLLGSVGCSCFDPIVSKMRRPVAKSAIASKSPSDCHDRLGLGDGGVRRPRPSRRAGSVPGRRERDQQAPNLDSTAYRKLGAGLGGHKGIGVAMQINAVRGACRTAHDVEQAIITRASKLLSPNFMTTRGRPPIERRYRFSPKPWRCATSSSADKRRTFSHLPDRAISGPATTVTSGSNITRFWRLNAYSDHRKRALLQRTERPLYSVGYRCARRFRRCFRGPSTGVFGMEIKETLTPAAANGTVARLPK